MPSAAASCRLPFPGGRDGDDCGFLVISGATFEWILLLLAFYGVGGGDDVDSAEDSWSRSVLCSSLGIELLCSPWGGFFIRVGGFVDGGFLFRLGRSVLPQPYSVCLESLVLFLEAVALRSAKQSSWRGGSGLLSRISCGFPMCGASFFIWPSGADGGCCRCEATLLQMMHMNAGLRKKMKDLCVILELHRGPFVKREALVPDICLF